MLEFNVNRVFSNLFIHDTFGSIYVYGEDGDGCDDVPEQAKGFIVVALNLATTKHPSYWRLYSLYLANIA